MGYRHKKRRPLKAFVPLTWELLNSKAYINMPPSAAKALPYFLGKVKLHPNEPDYCFTEYAFTYREAKRLGFASSTFKRCIALIVRYGFVDPVRKGGLRGDGKSTNKFKNSKRWLDYGKSDFIDVKWEEFI